MTLTAEQSERVLTCTGMAMGNLRKARGDVSHYVGVQECDSDHGHFSVTVRFNPPEAAAQTPVEWL